MVGQSLNIQALQRRVLELWKADQSSALELGKALVTTRDAMRDAHGDFAEWFDKAGLSENRVYYCIRLAEGKIAKSKEHKQNAKKEEKQKEQPAAEPLLTTEVWQLLSRHAANRGITPLALAQQICVPAISAWLVAQVPFTDSGVTEKVAE
jgi:hypothetical protein